MGYWNSRGLRGDAFEETINLTNERYRQEGIALIQKIPTPIVPVEMDQKTRIITKAYFDKKSTVDYIGVMNGAPLCFDAKETGKNFLPFSNIHPHQVAFMKDFAAQGGLAFLLVHLSAHGKYYLLPLEVLARYYDDADGRRSVPLSAFEERYRIPEPNPYLPYLSVAYRYLNDVRAAQEAKHDSAAAQRVPGQE